MSLPRSSCCKKQFEIEKQKARSKMDPPLRENSQNCALNETAAAQPSPPAPVRRRAPPANDDSDVEMDGVE